MTARSDYESSFPSVAEGSGRSLERRLKKCEASVIRWVTSETELGRETGKRLKVGTMLPLGSRDTSLANPLTYTAENRLGDLPRICLCLKGGSSCFFFFFFSFLLFFFLSGLGVFWRNLVIFKEKRRMISFKFTHLWENIIRNISYAQK